MYNLDEIKTIEDLKELCFYVKAINESRENGFESIEKINEYLVKEYNLEISVSKLYLFEQKIYRVFGNPKRFPSNTDLEKLISYQEEVREREIAEREVEVVKAELNLVDKKYKIGKNKFVSASELTGDLGKKQRDYSKFHSWLLLLSAIVAFTILGLQYLISSTFGWVFFNLPVTKNILLLILEFVVIYYFVYSIIYFLTIKNIKETKQLIDGFYRYKLDLQDDYLRLRTARAEESKLKNDAFTRSIISPVFLNNINREQEDIPIKATGIKGALIFSKKEQDRLWARSERASYEKAQINNEIVLRVNELAEYLKMKGLEKEELAKSISSYYCNDLSLTKRKEKLDDASSKYMLDKNYLEIVKKINDFEELSIFAEMDSNKKFLNFTNEEFDAFNENVLAQFQRIEKAIELKLLNDSKIKSYNKIKTDFEDNYIFGVNIKTLQTRFELCKLYVRLSDELKNYDVLN